VAPEAGIALAGGTYRNPAILHRVCRAGKSLRNRRNSRGFQSEKLVREQEKGIAFRAAWAHSEFVRSSEVRSRRRACWCGRTFKSESNRRLLMNLTISGHHLEVTPALRTYVTTKLDRITRHFDQVVDVKVLLTVEKQKEKERRQRAECNIHVKGSDLFAESSHEDLYAAVDELVDKLDRQVVRHKDRLQEHHHEAPKRLM
jgi:putative sigma-54 modulation protein